MNVHSKNPASPRRRGRPAVDDKRRRVLDAALVEFSKRGFHGTTIPEIASAAKVSTGTLYHYFEHKHQLVNEVYRDAKLRLRSWMLDQLVEPDLDKEGDAERWFRELWRRFAAFAKREPQAFKFLEMQDHSDYIDNESKTLELSLLAPMFMVGTRIHAKAGGIRIDVTIALMLGAFTGLVKAGRLGYLQLDDAALEDAGATTWRILAPEAERAREKKPPKRG
jgi:AcrR family transcriptional regulator